MKPWLHVQVYSQVSSGLPVDGKARQKPPLRQGRPSQGSGRGVAWVGVGSAGAGVSGASWKGEGGTAPMLLLLLLLLRSRRRRSTGGVKLRAICVGRQQGPAGTLLTLILIPLLWLPFLLFCCCCCCCVYVFSLFPQSSSCCCLCWLDSATATERCVCV